MSTNGNHFLSFVIGAAAGGVAAVLLAPMSGHEARSRERASELVGRVRDAAVVHRDALGEALRAGIEAYEKARNAA